MSVNMFLKTLGVFAAIFPGLNASPIIRQATAPSPPDSFLRIHIHPEPIRLLPDSDYINWVIPTGGEISEASTTINGLDLTLSSPDGQIFDGNYYKYFYARFLALLGEWNVGAGVSTDNDDTGAAHPIELTITGLAEGEHTLLTWHNAWDSLDEAATLTVSVNGESAASDVSQSVRLDNIWESGASYISFTVGSASDTTTITYTPSGGDGRVFLNGIEIDGAALANQVSFPSPENKFERVEPQDGAVTATWRAPSNGDSVTYNVYLGTTPEELTSVGEGLTETTLDLTDLNTLDTYYWRVDVVSGDNTYIGRNFMFRLAHLAFPGAEGYGRLARGGRGGKVVHVTTLEDNEEEGSLRHALTVATGPRTVVFDVGGVITTTSRLTLNDPYVTIAGQTAPGKGIALQGHPFGLSGASDVIIRHMRVRPGTVSGITVDGMGMQGSNYCIFDRSSMGWAIDECFSSRSAYNITFQRNMISEPMNIAGHQNYPEGTEHGYAATIGGDIGSYHHNLIAHAEGRSWSLGGGVDNLSNFAGRIDIRNNVVYNFGNRVTDGGAHEVNFVGNYYKPGPGSPDSITYALRAQYEDGLPGTQQYHCAGNSMPGHFTQDSTQYVDDGTGQSEDIACFADVTIDPEPSYQKFFAEPFFNGENFVEGQSSTEAYKIVLSDSGASQPVQDEHDARIIDETLEGTYTYVGSVSGKLGIIDSDADVGGLEDFPETTRPASWDADGDGIADWWTGGAEDGYTAIEGYLNFMADPHAFVAPGGSVEVDLAALAKGFVDPVFTVSGEATLGTVAVSGGTATYSTEETAGVDGFEISLEDAEGSVWTIGVGIAIFEQE